MPAPPRRPLNHEPPLSLPTRLASTTPAPRMDRAREMGPRAGMTDDALPTPRSIPHGYGVSAWCRACQHTVRLDLPALIAGGHGDVPLIHLPLRCRSRDNYVDIANAGRISPRGGKCSAATPRARGSRPRRAAPSPQECRLLARFRDRQRCRVAHRRQRRDVG